MYSRTRVLVPGAEMLPRFQSIVQDPAESSGAAQPSMPAWPHNETTIIIPQPIPTPAAHEVSQKLDQLHDVVPQTLAWLPVLAAVVIVLTILLAMAVIGLRSSRGVVSSGSAGGRALLVYTWAVLFVRYSVATILSGYFIPIATQAGISPTWNGLIFGSFPLGAALASISTPCLMQRLGAKRAIAIGLLASAASSVTFMLAPLGGTTAPPGTSPAIGCAIALASNFLNGLVGGLSETTCLILSAQHYRREGGGEHLSKVMASISSVCGLGCMLGPGLGGLIYDAVHAAGPAVAFRLPLQLACLLTLLLLLPLRLSSASLPLRLPDPKLDPGGGGAPFSSVVSPSMLLGLASTLVSSIVVAALDPTLSYRLQGPPFGLSDSLLALSFTFSSLAYVLAAGPVGALCDVVRKLRTAAASRALKALSAAGFFLLGASFALLAPAGPRPHALNSAPVVGAALLLRGAGSALSLEPLYPDLMLTIPKDDPMIDATVSAVWNGAYTIGWAMGPVVGSALYEVLRPPVGEPCLRGLERGHGVVVEGLACEWHPHNGFDDMAQLLAAICIAYICLVAGAALFNVHSSPPQHSTKS